MNSPTEISPSTQLILDELRKLHNLFDKFDARWAMREASRDVPVPTPSAAVGDDVVADNWGGLFDGGDDSDEQHREAPIVADNWGGLFEQLAHTLEERDLESTDSDALTFMPAPDATFDSIAADLSAHLLGGQAEQCPTLVQAPHLFPYATTAAAASRPNSTIDPPQELGFFTKELAPKDTHQGVGFFVPKLDSEADPPVPNRVLVDTPLLSDGEDEISSIDLSVPPHSTDGNDRGRAMHHGTDVELDLRDLPTRPPSPRTPAVGYFPEPLMETLLYSVDSLMEKLPCSFAALGLTSSFPDCIRNPCAEDDGADDPVDPGPKFASRTSFRIRVGAEVSDLFRKLDLNGAEDIAIYHGFQLPDSGVAFTCFLHGGVLHRFKHGISAMAFLSKRSGGTCSTARLDPSDAAMRRAIRVLDDVLLAASPASEVLTGQATKDHFAKACTIARPDAPDAAVRRDNHLLHGNDFAELGRGEEDLDGKLMGSTRYCATSHQLVIECKPYLDARLVFEEMPSKDTTTAHSVHSVSSLPFYGAINICEGHKIFVEMIGPNPVVLALLLAVNKPQWPPPWLDCNTKLVTSNQLYFGFWSLFCLGWVVVQYMPPWSPPHQLEMLSDGVQLRPTPWPSFICLTTWCNTCSVHECLMQLLFGAINRGLTQFDSLSHGFVISFVGLIAEMRFFSSMVLLLSILPVQKHHQLLSPDALIIIHLVDLNVVLNLAGCSKVNMHTFEFYSVLMQLIKYYSVHHLPSPNWGDHHKLDVIVAVYNFNSSVLLHLFTTTVEAQTASTMWLLLAINSLAYEEFQFSFEIGKMMGTTVMVLLHNFTMEASGNHLISFREILIWAWECWISIFLAQVDLFRLVPWNPGDLQLLLSLSMAGCALIQQRVQRKCGGNYRCFLLEVTGHNFLVATPCIKCKVFCREFILLDLCFLTTSKEVQFGANCLHLTTSKARPYLLIETQELHGVVYGEMPLPWSCYELTQDPLGLFVTSLLCQSTSVLQSSAQEGNAVFSHAKFSWDPGGSILLYRLGGKPNPKERGMLGTSHGWASHMGHGPRAQSRYWMGDYICQGPAARRASNN